MSAEVLEEKMESHGLQGHKEFTLKSSVKAFNILSDSLYMNKALAVIRELSTNARDAHISAGTEATPFEIHLPNEMSPYFYIRDYGTGLAHDDVLNLYTTYFDSTKSDSVDATGALGLGSKSPFSMVDDFSVVSFQNGVARTYFAYKNDEGFPCISFISEDSASDEANGIKIQFAVRRDKFADFQNNIQFALYHFDPHPTILNVPVNIKKETIVAHGADWEIAANRNQGQVGFYLGDKPIVVMARISYPLDVQQLEHLFAEEDQYLLSVCKVPLRIHVKNRSVDHTPSREHLQYNKKTVNALRLRLKEIYDEIFQKIQQEFSDCLSLDDVYERVTYLHKIDETNIRVNPWKSKLKVFKPKEFTVFTNIFYSKITLENVDPKTGKTIQLTPNLGHIYQNVGISQHNNVITTLQLDDNEYYGMNAVTVGSVWSRIEAKSFDTASLGVSIKTDEELLIQNHDKTIEELRRNNLIQVRNGLSVRKSHHRYTGKFNEKWATTVDCFGNVVSAKTLDRKATSFNISITRKCIDMVLVIDDYPKDFSAIMRAGYARAQTRNYTDYVVFTNIARTGGRFVKDEITAFEATVRHIGKKMGAKVIHASEIILPEEFTKIERAPSMAKNEYCAFNVLHFDQRGSCLTETSADAMGDDFTLPGFDDDSVIFLRRQYSQVYTVGDEGERTQQSHEYKLGDAKYVEIEEVIRFVSVFAGRDILKNKTLVIIKTKAQYQKAMEKSKWTRFDKYVKSIISKFDARVLKQLAATFMMSDRNGFRDALTSYNSSSKKIMHEMLKTCNIPVEELTVAISAVSGLFAHVFAKYSDKYESMVESKDEAEIILKSMPDGIIKDLFSDASAVFGLNECLVSEDKSMFRKFTAYDCGTCYFKNSNVKSLILHHTAMFEFLYHTLDKKFIVHLFDFVLQSYNAVKKYPLLSLFSSRFTAGEVGFNKVNLERSSASIQNFIDYISLVEGK